MKQTSRTIAATALILGCTVAFAPDEARAQVAAYPPHPAVTGLPAFAAPPIYYSPPGYLTAYPPVSYAAPAPILGYPWNSPYPAYGAFPYYGYVPTVAPYPYYLEEIEASYRWNGREYSVEVEYEFD